MDDYVCLLLFAHRHMSQVADDLLSSFGLGRSHHRSLFMIGLKPGLPGQDLARILQVTYQGLHRVLSDLLKAELIEQRLSPEDKRLRLLFLTKRGADLRDRCAQAQSTVLKEAADRAGASTFEALQAILYAMSTEADRLLFQELMPDRARQLEEKTGSRFDRKARSPSR